MILTSVELSFVAHRRFSGCVRVRRRRNGMRARHLQVTVGDAERVEVIDALEHLLHHLLRVLLGERAALHDAVKEFAASHPDARVSPGPGQVSAYNSMTR